MRSNDLTITFKSPVVLAFALQKNSRTGEPIESKAGECMKVKFTLTMDDVIVDNQHLDNIILDWEEELNQEEIMELSQKWITSKNFLTSRMIGLTQVGESSLTIEPVD